MHQIDISKHGLMITASAAASATALLGAQFNMTSPTFFLNSLYNRLSLPGRVDALAMVSAVD